MPNYIPLSVPNMKGNELEYVTKAIEQEWVSTGGACIEQLENNFADYAKINSAAAVQSGTAALHLALLGCGVGPGDLVIAPTLTFIAAINPIRYVGADPIFTDCDKRLCISAGQIESYLKTKCRMAGGVPYDMAQNRPVRAIIVVHVFGNGADMEPIMDLASAYNLKIIEDATEAVGTFYTSGRYAGKMAGTIGDFGAYSFNGNKIMTTGGGGMITALNLESVAQARHLSTQAKADARRFLHDAVGYNYRMTNLQAAVGVAQMERLESFVQVKTENYRLYQEQGIRLLPFADDVRPNYWFYSYETERRDALIEELDRQKIQTRPIWGLIHESPVYSSCYAMPITAAKEYYRRTVNLPCSTNLTKTDVKRVADAVKIFEKEAND